MRNSRACNVPPDRAGVQTLSKQSQGGEAQSWTRAARETHPLVTYFLMPSPADTP